MRHKLLVTLLAVFATMGSFLAASPAAAVGPTVAAVRAAHHPGYDRVVFQFSGGLPTQRSIQYVSHVIADPSGKTVSVQGRYFAVLRLFPATAYGSSVPATVTPRLANLTQVVRSGDFEAVLSYAFGLQQRVPLHMFTLTNPSRVVIDVPVLSWPLLQTGSRGPNVTAAQDLLRANGYPVSADGVFGARTRVAVVAFAKAHRLTADGVVGPRVWAALTSTLRSGNRGDAVRALQVELRKNGYAVGVDGVFGSMTLTAVRRSQAANALPVDGIVGPMTWMALICRHN